MIVFLYFTGESKIGYVPRLGITGISGAITNGGVIGNTYGNITTMNYYGTTRYIPKYGITGYVPVGYYVLRTTIEVFDKKNYLNKAYFPLWRVDVIGITRNGDIRKVYNTLIKASGPYIGTNTDKAITLYP